jgi:DNA modification methylase
MIRNKRSVWTVTTKPFKDAHFATFPEDLIVDCIKAGCPENGIVLDPFMGAGTTALVARKLNRNYIGFELNREYIKIAEKRLSEELGMFL